MEQIVIADFNSAGIREYARIAGAATMARETSFGEGDARITFYRLNTGELVADTNGDPVLGYDAAELLEQLQDPEDFQREQDELTLDAEDRTLGYEV
jgi:hypothetical protein